MKQYYDKKPAGVDDVLFKAKILEFKGNKEEINKYISSLWEGEFHNLVVPRRFL